MKKNNYKSSKSSIGKDIAIGTGAAAVSAGVAYGAVTLMKKFSKKGKKFEDNLTDVKDGSSNE